MMEKTLEAYNDVFADIVNVLLFQGKAVVSEDDLEDERPRSIYKADGKLHEQERDVAKYWKNCNVRIAMYGMENQTTQDEDISLRTAGYDGAAYRAQLLEDKKKEPLRDSEEAEPGTQAGKKRYPVVTLVLYFGKSRWKKPLSLHDRLDIPQELLPYVSDYKVNLFEIAWLEDEQVNLFQSDFRIVADYFVQMRKNKDYQPSIETIKHVDEVLKMMAVLTGDSRYEDIINESKEGELNNMCEVLDRIEARGEARGETRGMEKGMLQSILSLMKTMKWSAEQAMEKLEIPATEREKYLQRLNS